LDDDKGIWKLFNELVDDVDDVNRLRGNSGDGISGINGSSSITP
jgi:hypothetical protein